MRLIFSDRAWEDYLHWQTVDRKMLKRINKLIKDALRSPFDGLGKPEPLRGDWEGFWSRRIDRERRLVYSVRGGEGLAARGKSHAALRAAPFPPFLRWQTSMIPESPAVYRLEPTKNSQLSRSADFHHGLLVIAQCRYHYQ